MADPTGESKSEALRLDFDRRLILQFRGSMITTDSGLLAYRELDDVLDLTTGGGERLAEARTGKNRQHLLVGLLQQSVLGRLAGYEDVNDAKRLCHDPAMRWVVGGGAPMGRAASTSQMGRFETEWLARPENLAALADLPGEWIDTCAPAATAEEHRPRHGFKQKPNLRRTGRQRLTRPFWLHLLPPALLDKVFDDCSIGIQGTPRGSEVGPMTPIGESGTRIQTGFDKVFLRQSEKPSRDE